MTFTKNAVTKQQMLQGCLEPSAQTSASQIFRQSQCLCYLGPEPEHYSDPALPNPGLEEGGRDHTGLCGHRVTPLPVEKIPVGSASLLSSSAGHGLSSWLTSSHPGAWSPVAREEGEENRSARMLESQLWYLLAGWL